MARYRPIRTHTWNDPDFQNYEPIKKLIFIYLITNEILGESGVYPMTITTISNNTGVEKDKVKVILSSKLKNVLYDYNNQVVYVRRFLHYNGNTRPEMLIKCVQSDFHRTDTSPLWLQFIEDYPAYKPDLPDLKHLNAFKGKGCDTLDNGLVKGCQRVGQPFYNNSNSNSHSNNKVKGKINNTNINNKNKNKIEEVEEIISMGEIDGKKLQPHQRLVLLYKDLRGIDINNKKWDREHFARYCGSAKKILGIFDNDEKKCVRCMKDLSYEFERKLTNWTFETIVKYCFEWEAKNKRGVK